MAWLSPAWFRSSRAFRALTGALALAWWVGCYQVDPYEPGGDPADDSGPGDPGDDPNDPGDDPNDPGDDPNDAGDDPAGNGPVIEYFRAQRNLVAFLEPAVLEWRVTGATSCTLSPGGVPISNFDSQLTLPSDEAGVTTSYRLLCTDGVTTVAEDTEVEVTRREYDGDLVLSSPAQLESFSYVNHVRGDLVVQGIFGEEDLSALEGLIEVDGDLVIEGTPNLQSIELPWLETVGGDLWIDDNSALSAFSFTRLTSIGRNLYLSRNPRLSDFLIGSLISGLTSIDAIGGRVVRYDNEGATILPMLVGGTQAADLLCANDLYLLQLRAGQAAAFGADASGNFIVPVGSGTYSLVGPGTMNPQLRLDLSDISLVATSTDLRFELDALSHFDAHEVECDVVGLGENSGLGANRTVTCPNQVRPSGQTERWEMFLSTGSTAQLRISRVVGGAVQPGTDHFGVYRVLELDGEDPVVTVSLPGVPNASLRLFTAVVRPDGIELEIDDPPGLCASAP